MAPASVRARAAAGTLAFVAGDGLAVGDAPVEPELEGDGDADEFEALGVGVAVGPSLSLQPAKASAAMDNMAAVRPQVLFTDFPTRRVSRTGASLGKGAQCAT